MKYLFLAILKVINLGYYEKHFFSGLYIYKPVLPEPANSQNEESKQVLHGLCSPPTGKTALLQAVQIQLLSLDNKRRYFHRPASSQKHAPLSPEISERGAFIHSSGEVQCVQWYSSSVLQCRHSELDMQTTLLLVAKINISTYILSQLQKSRGDSGCV